MDQARREGRRNIGLRPKDRETRQFNHIDKPRHRAHVLQNAPLGVNANSGGGAAWRRAGHGAASRCTREQWPGPSGASYRANTARTSRRRGVLATSLETVGGHEGSVPPAPTGTSWRYEQARGVRAWGAVCHDFHTNPFFHKCEVVNAWGQLRTLRTKRV